MKLIQSLAANRFRLIAAVALGTLTLLAAGDDSARLEKLGHKVICMCGCNQVLLECNHVGCSYSDHMREELMAAIQHGDNDSMALQTFVQKYGTTVLAAPTDKGFNRVAWIMPYLALVLGLGVVTMVVRAWARKAIAVRQAAGPADPALEPFRTQARRETEI